MELCITSRSAHCYVCWPFQLTRASSASRACAARWRRTDFCLSRLRSPVAGWCTRPAILYLAVVAGVLLFIFGGITDALIPLFAIGAFLTFTLSQAGMVVHWLRHSDRMHLWINGIGACTTAMALVVIVLAKFKEGAWITVIVIPLVVVMLRTIHTYYTEVERRTKETEPLRLYDTRPPVVLVVMERWNKLAYKALNFALSLSHDVIAVHLLHLAGPDDEGHRELQQQWQSYVERPVREAGLRPPRLVLIPAQRRRIHEPDPRSRPQAPERERQPPHRGSDSRDDQAPLVPVPAARRSRSTLTFSTHEVRRSAAHGDRGAVDVGQGLTARTPHTAG